MLGKIIQFPQPLCTCCKERTASQQYAGLCICCAYSEYVGMDGLTQYQRDLVADDAVRKTVGQPSQSPAALVR